MSFAMSCGFNIIGNVGVRCLQRHGLKADGCYGKTDNLHIYYDGNRIKSVLEDAGAVTQYGSMDYPGGHRELAFEYDASGSLVKDESRGITSIEYDSFGNPLRIDYKSGNYTKNVYSATGEKLKTEHRKNMLQAADMPGAAQTLSSGAGPETVFPGLTPDLWELGGLTRMEYRGPVVWRNGRIDMVRFPGGYATVGDSVVFHYYTQDYLGNNRAVVNGMTGEVEQTVAYYPYGGIIPDLSTGLSKQDYKFGGKELITANGLNEYDFGARQYYQAVPHFTRIDPMCEKYYWLSPYLYCANNPVNAFDPNGMDIWALDQEGYLINTQSFEEYDLLIVMDDQNKIKATWKGDYGTISNKFTNKDNNNQGYSLFEVNGDDAGTEVFEFFAENTSVEWSQLKTGFDTESPNYVSTSKKTSSDSSTISLILENLKNVNIRFDIHSHPNGSEFPSGMELLDPKGDIGYAIWLESFAPNLPIFLIYNPIDKRYIEYNSKSIKSDFRAFYKQLFSR